MNHYDLHALISIRDFLVRSMDNLYIKLSKEQVSAMNKKISYLDGEIIKDALKICVSDDTITLSVSSTEELKSVLDSAIAKADTKKATDTEISVSADGVVTVFSKETLEPSSYLDGESVSSEEEKKQAEVALPQEPEPVKEVKKLKKKK